MNELQLNMYKVPIQVLSRKFSNVYGSIEDAKAEFQLIAVETLATGIVPTKTEMNVILESRAISAYRKTKAIKRSKYFTLYANEKEAADATNADNFLPDLNSASVDAQVLVTDAYNKLHELNINNATNVFILSALQKEYTQADISRALNRSESYVSKQIRKIKRDYVAKYGNPLFA